MDFDHYQRQAAVTDQFLGDNSGGELAAFLGLAGGAGTLLSEYKRHLRGGMAHEEFAQRIADEIGNLFWYLGRIARHHGLSLDAIATENLARTRQRWLHP